MNIPTHISNAARKVRQHFQAVGDLPLGQPIKSNRQDLRLALHDAYLRDESPEDLSPGRGLVQTLELHGSDGLRPNHTTTHYQGTTENGWVRSTQLLSKDGEPFQHESVDLVHHSDIHFQGNEATSLVLLEGPTGFDGFLIKETYRDGKAVHTEARSFTNHDYQEFLLATLSP